MFAQFISVLIMFSTLLAPVAQQAQLTPEEIPGYEAIGWLSDNKNECALAANRFASTEDALEFVQHLYELGAVNVEVPDECIYDDKETIESEGGPYADALVVYLPQDPDARAAVLAVCRVEVENEGFEMEDDGEDFVFLWWD